MDKKLSEFVQGDQAINFITIYSFKDTLRVVSEMIVNGLKAEVLIQVVAQSPVWTIDEKILRFEYKILRVDYESSLDQVTNALTSVVMDLVVPMTGLFAGLIVGEISKHYFGEVVEEAEIMTLDGITSSANLVSVNLHELNLTKPYFNEYPVKLASFLESKSKYRLERIDLGMLIQLESIEFVREGLQAKFSKGELLRMGIVENLGSLKNNQ